MQQPDPRSVALEAVRDRLGDATVDLAWNGRRRDQDGTVTDAFVASGPAVTGGRMTIRVTDGVAHGLGDRLRDA